MSTIITVASTKGGVGKTALAYEVATALQGVLVDLDWGPGSASESAWGYRGRRRQHDLLSNALTDLAPAAATSAPRPLHMPGRPALVPSDPGLGQIEHDPDAVAERLEVWARAWDAPFVVVDTHPGGGALADGAMSAATLTVVPVLLRERDLDAVEGLVTEYGRLGYRLALVPNMVAVPPLRAIERLEHLEASLGVPILPSISEHRWWARRMRHQALCAIPNPPPTIRRATTELKAAATAIRALCNGT